MHGGIPKEKLMDFSEKLKVLRAESGLTQEQLAERLMLTRQAVSNYEQGRSWPSLDTLARMSELFGVGLDELLASAFSRRHAGAALIGSGLCAVSLFFALFAAALIAGSHFLYAVLLACDYLIPLLCLWSGLFLVLAPPKRNLFFGYRTRRALQNDTLWSAAQTAAGRALAVSGGGTLILTDLTVLTAALLGPEVFWIGSAALVPIQLISPLIAVVRAGKKLKALTGR